MDGGDMERRKILLGSGATFAATLAGCIGLTSDDGDAEPGDDDSGDTASGSSGGDTGSDSGGDDTGSESDGDDDGDEHVTIPGLEDDLGLEEYDVKVTHATYDGNDVDVGLKLEKHPDDVTEKPLRKHAEKFASAVGDSIEDRDHLEKDVETITFAVYDLEGELVLKLFLNVGWLLAYVDDELDLEELVDKMLEKRE